MIRTSAALNATLSSRDRRALRAGLRIVTPALFYVALVKPYVAAIRHLRDEVRAQYALMVGEEQVVAELPTIQAKARPAAMADARAAARVYDATDTALAMTALGRDVTTALQDAGLTIQRIEMRDSVARRSGRQELTIDVSAQGDFEAILAALVRLEANARLIRVSRLSIDKAAGGAPTSSGSLAFAAVVHGYAK